MPLGAVAALAAPLRAAQPPSDAAEPSNKEAAASPTNAVPAPKKNYELEVSRPPALEVGKAADVGFTIKPKPGYVLKVQTPFELTLKASPGLTAAKPKLTAKDFVDPKSETKTVKAAVTAVEPGAQSLAADLMFFLCTPAMCERMTDKVEMNLPAK